MVVAYLMADAEDPAVKDEMLETARPRSRTPRARVWSTSDRATGPTPTSPTHRRRGTCQSPSYADALFAAAIVTAGNASIGITFQAMLCPKCRTSP